MRYWAYVNNEVRGPFEKERLAALPGFAGSWVICPEDQAAGAAPGWKEASNYPEVMNALNQPPAPAPAAAPPPVPAPAPAQEKPPAESPLLMTMRGTLISDPVVDGHVVEKPAAAPAPAPASTPAQAPEPAQEKPKPAESPLAMTMRGTLISDPVVDGHVVERFPSADTPPRVSAAAPAPAPAPAAGGGTDPVMRKLDQISAMLASLANGQSQLLERVGRAEASVAAMKALLFPEQPKK